MRQGLMKTQSWLFLLTTVFTLLLTILWGVNLEAETPNDALRLFFWQAPTQFNPHLSSGFKDLAAARMTYEPLASFDREGRLIPVLAAEIPSLENGGVAPDGRSVTWKLKPKVAWYYLTSRFTFCNILFYIYIVL